MCAHHKVARCIKALYAQNHADTISYTQIAFYKRERWECVQLMHTSDQAYTQFPTHGCRWYDKVDINFIATFYLNLFF